jgi:hypothetical protein
VAPFALYMALLVLQSWAPGSLWWIYPLKTLAVAAVLWGLRGYYVELRPAFPAAGIAVGIAAIVVWIAIDPYYPKLSALLGQTPPSPFDPTTLTPIAVRWMFLAFRVAGAAVVVPLMEELFWRGFLIRWIDNPNFKAVPLGAFAWRSFVVTSVLFGIEHEQWLAGVVCGALYNGLLYRERNLFSCVLAHAVSNTLLAVWVLAYADWKFW